MKNLVADLLDSFDHLPEDAKREAASEIIKRSANFDFPPLSDDALVEIADHIFLALEKEESTHD